MKAKILLIISTVREALHPPQKIAPFILKGIIALGITLAIVNFFGFRNLWLDEAMLALNIKMHSILELLEPLDYGQVAPIGFLLIEKFFAHLLGYTDWSMRILPLLFYFWAVYITYLVSLELIKDRVFALFAAALFSTSWNILYYSSEVKQYMGELSMGLFIVFLALKLSDTKTSKGYGYYAILGSITVWFSHVAILFISTSAVFLVLKARGRQILKPLFLVIASWFISFLVYYLLFIHDHPTKGFMINFWANLGAFMPQNIASPSFFKDLFEKIQIALVLLTHSNWLRPLFAFLTLVGIFFLSIKKPSALWLLLGPVIIHLGLAYLKMYPFHSRLVLYQVPLCVILVSAGAYLLFAQRKTLPPLITILVLPLLIINNFFSIQEHAFPMKNEEVKPALRYLNENIEEEDVLFIDDFARAGYAFYLPYFPKIKNLKTEQMVTGICHGDSCTFTKGSLNQLDRKVWVLTTNLFSRAGRTRKEKLRETFEFFHKQGYELEISKNFHGASIHKFTKK